MGTQLSWAISGPPRLHHAIISSCRHGVCRLCLKEKELAYESRVVGMTIMEHLATVPFVKRIDEEIAPDQVSEKQHPRVVDWWARIQARPAFARVNIGPFATTDS